ncbi:MAG: TniQ family protein [Marinobacter sp.]|uniref:TniQ family protein n=1 Tax=Marinobacter sp. TaxID=50741 RepID=UPI001B49C4ED|nr:TniQ family protein [Marinobacter sp.]MBQ0746728.1 TniQ family protein [Marinobacter sp.]MBQ0814396.1 TniQ family protein [Marinobacter sp.]
MTRLAVRPLPVEGESLTGYLLRLGKLNCIFKPSEILDVLGVGKSSHVVKGWCQPAFGDLFDALETRLERPVRPYLRQFQRQDDLPWQRDWTRLIQDVRTGYPRICPQCIAETGVLDWRWGLAFTSMCPKHSSLLTAECPSCKKALTPSGTLLLGCDKCEMDWAEFEAPMASEISDLELQLWAQLEQDPSNVDPTVIQDLCRAIVHMMRPFDSLHDTLEAAPRLIEHSAYVARAYRTLQEPEFFAQWRKQCYEKRKDLMPLGEEFLEAPCQLFRDGLLNDWNGPARGSSIPLDSIALGDELSENTRYIAQPRREAAFESGEGVGYRYQLDIASIASIKEWSEEVAEDLVGNGVFPTFKNVAQSKKRRFDASQIIGKLRQFAVQTADGFIEVDADSPAFRKNFANPGMLVNDILKKVIPGGFGEDKLLSRFFVNESRFEKWLFQQRKSATRRSVPLNKAAVALDCTEQDVRRLVEEQKLKWATHREWEKWIDGPSLFEYMICLD